MFVPKFSLAVLLIVALVVPAPEMFVAADEPHRVFLPGVRTLPPPPPTSLEYRPPNPNRNVWAQHLAWGGSEWNTLFATTSADTLATREPGGLYRSMNAGRTWEHLNMGRDIVWPNMIEMLTVHPITPTLLFATVEAKLYRSEDSGTTWRTDLAGLPNLRVHDVAIDRLRPNRIYANATSSLLGTGWSVVGTYMSDDTGLTWRHQSDETMEDDWFEGIAVDPKDSKLLYGSRGRFLSPIEGIYRSDDEGRSWVQLNQYPNPHVLIDPSTPGRMYQFGGTTYGIDGFMQTMDGGSTWRSITPDDTGVSFLHSGIVSTVALDPGYPDILWAGMQYSGLWRSVDAGSTWEHLVGRTGTFGVSCYSIAIAPNRTVAVACDGLLFVSRN